MRYFSYNAIGLPFGGGKAWNPAEYIPTGLTVSVKSSTSAYLSWTLPAGIFDGVRVYSSTDGTNYSQVGSDLSNTTTNYTHSSIDTGSARYWKVVTFKGSKESLPSNVVNLDWFTMECTTTEAQTLTLQRVDCVAGDGITIFWGDGTSNSYTNANNNATKTKAYAGAGTYSVKIANPLNISIINFTDTKLTNFNTNQFLKCGNNLTSLTLDTLGNGRVINSSNLSHLILTSVLSLCFYQPGTYTINSDHFKNYALTSQLSLIFDQSGTYTINSDHFKNYTLTSHLSQLYLYFSQSGTYTINSDHFKNYALTYRLYLYFIQSGTYTINSDHFKNYALTSVLSLYFTQSGTYTINSDHFKNYTLTSQLYLYFNQPGTYTINSDHFKNYTLTSQLYLYFSQSGTYTINTSHFKNYTVNNNYYLLFNTTGTFSKTISRSDFTLYRVPTVTIQMGLSQTDVDNILLGFWDAFASKTNTGGTITLNGSGNSAPSGTYQAQCPPTTGKEAAYELLNDSCNVSPNHWATINVVGGL